MVLGQKEVGMRRIAYVALAGLLLGLLAYAGEMEGVTFPDKITVGTSNLVLNGMGIRTKMFFKIYIGALYLPAKESDPAKILAADEPKQLVMHFLYSEVSKEKLLEAWAEGFEYNSEDKMGALEIKGKEMGVIEGKEFAQALFAIWLGPEPPTAALKKGLLGK
jgi:hypothetical protein